MSASLVGSEMCIRDSATRNAQRATHNAQRTPHNAHRTTHDAQRKPRTPVSYTHLTLPTICSV
eukprot:2827700-Alexandrium_andersonii.AAC.1